MPERIRVAAPSKCKGFQGLRGLPYRASSNGDSVFPAKRIVTGITECIHDGVSALEPEIYSLDDSLHCVIVTNVG
jgi:hypothetical protein